MDKHETTSKSRLKSQPQERIGKEPKKTKILAIGDIHGDTGLVKGLLRERKRKCGCCDTCRGLNFCRTVYRIHCWSIRKSKKTRASYSWKSRIYGYNRFLAEAYPNTKIFMLEVFEKQFRYFWCRNCEHRHSSDRRWEYIQSSKQRAWRNRGLPEKGNGYAHASFWKQGRDVRVSRF